VPSAVSRTISPRPSGRRLPRARSIGQVVTDPLSRMRRPYEAGRLEQADLAPTWHDQLRRWLEEAERSRVPEPTAMLLASADAGGAPSVRTVLLKGLDERGLRFYTNLRSRKGRELSENPQACACFSWTAIERQVTVDGRVEALPDADSDAYFESRPRGSRLAALASPQSQVIRSRAALDEAYAEAARTHPEAVPRPAWWGGLCLVPSAVEFWQGRPDRLHDRLRYRRTPQQESWTIERLAP